LPHGLCAATCQGRSCSVGVRVTLTVLVLALRAVRGSRFAVRRVPFAVRRSRFAVP
jgi:hypothetical protein